LTTRSLAVAVLCMSFGLSLVASSSAAPPDDAQAAAARPGSLALTVVGESGSVVSGAAVTVHGAVDRKTVTGADGVATVTNLPAGTYRCRVMRDGFITLEKEIVVRAGARAAAEAVVSAAAPSAAPPPPPPAEKPKPTPPPPQTVMGPVGQPRTASLTDLAEAMLREKDRLKDPIVERDLGCSVAAASKLILVRETLESHAHADADEIVYILAGDATLRISDKDQALAAGWYALVPRGTAHSISRRGRNAPIVLSVQSGHPCGS
jgi:quercetin dioxygenase-like cupin family protein